jgi:two-component system sensor histidine kinase YesM
MKINRLLIVSYSLTAMLPLLSACLVIYLISAKSLEESTLDFAELFNSQVVANIDSFYNDYDQLTKSVLVDSEAISNLRMQNGLTITEKVDQQLELRRIMMRLVTVKPEIISVCILTDEGRLFSSGITGENLSASALSEESWINGFRDQTERTLDIAAIHVRAYSDRQQDRLVLSVMRRILDKSGVPVGILAIDLDPDALVKLSDHFLLARNQYNIKISVTTDKNELAYDSDVASGQITWQRARGSTNKLLYEKKPSDYVLLTSRSEPGGLNVNAVIPKSKLLLKINRVGGATIMSLSFALLVVILISTTISRFITKLVRSLESSMMKVENGEYLQMPLVEGGNEIVSLAASYNRMAGKIKTLVEEVLVAQIKQKDAQLLALQLQINPHMLYNTLESIRMKAIMSDEDEIADMVKILARMFRLALNSKTGLHKVKDELEYAKNYLRLQNIRKKDAFALTAEIDPAILDSDIIILIFQPLIENSIKHSLPKCRALHILIRGCVANGDMLLCVEDDGTGMTEEKVAQVNQTLLSPENDNSIGLSNIARRIRMLCGDQYYIRIQKSGPSGTLIEIRLPLSKNICDSGKRGL